MTDAQYKKYKKAFKEEALKLFKFNNLNDRTSLYERYEEVELTSDLHPFKAGDKFIRVNLAFIDKDLRFEDFSAKEHGFSFDMETKTFKHIY